MRGLRFLILAVAIAAGVTAVALVRTELERARLMAEAVPTQAPAVVVPEIPKTEVLVSVRDMRMGEPVRPVDLRWQSWPVEAVSEFFITKEDRPNAIDSVKDTVVRRGLVAGEPITDSKLLQLDQPGVMSALLREGMRAIAVRISPETGAGGFILPGSYVDILLTRTLMRGEQELEETQTLMRSVRVLAIDQYIGETDEEIAEIGRTATLEVTPGQAENLALAEGVGTLTLILRGVSELVAEDGSSVIEPIPETTFDLRRESILEEPEGVPERETRTITVFRGNHKQRAVIE